MEVKNVFLFEEEFNKKLTEIFTEDNYSVISDEYHYNDIIKKVEESYSKEKKSTLDKMGSFLHYLVEIKSHQQRQIF